MAWNGLQITRRGQDLNAKILLGQTELTITRVAAGDGTATGSVVNLTDLVHETLPMPITSSKRLPDGTALFSTLLSNEELTTGFFFREIGVFASDPDLGDILYSYDYYGTDPQWIPAAGGATLIKAKYNLGMKISSAMDVVIKLDEDLQFMTRDELASLVGEPDGIAPLDAEGKVPLMHLPPIDAGGVKTVNGVEPDGAGDVTLGANSILRTDNFSVESHQGLQDNAIVALQETTTTEQTFNAISSMVWSEEPETTSASRVVKIDVVDVLYDLIFRPLAIRAVVNGVSDEEVTLTVNALDPMPIIFAPIVGAEAETTSTDNWVRAGFIYELMFNGTAFVLSNPQLRDATDEHFGLTRVIDNITTDTGSLALSARQGGMLAGRIAENSAQIAIVWEALFTNLTENPFMVTFQNLTGVNVVQGMWNSTAARLEC